MIGVGQINRLHKCFSGATAHTVMGTLLALCPLFMSSPSWGEDKSAIQRNARALANNGNAGEAIESLRALRKHYPDDPTIQRDLLIVYGAAENCPQVLRLYGQLPPVLARERAVISATATCLIDNEFYLRAIAVLTPAVRQNPNDQAIRELYVNARAKHDGRPRWFTYNGVEAGPSDIGGSKASLESELSRQLDDYTSVYARLNFTQEHDPILADGSFQRIGVGVDRKTISGFKFRGEVSSSIDGTGNTGYLLATEYAHSNRLTLRGSYTSYAEDIPLPAIAIGVYSDRVEVGASFNSDDWVYEGSAAYRSYGFSDSNRRQTVDTDLGFAYSRQPDRWRRVGITINHEQNTLSGAAYFNPSDANTVLVYHSWEIPRQSRFKQLQDKFTVKAGLYAQAGYSSDYIGELLYERKYTLSDHSWIELGASLASNLYDGVRETDTTLQASYSREF